MEYHSLANKKTVPPHLAKEVGVYTLHALNSDKLPQQICRVFKTDNKGILYIGETHKQSFHARVEMFKRVMNLDKKATRHSGALNFREVKVLREKFPLDCLHMTFEVHDQPKKREKELIEIYRQEFGEVPPLNSSK